MQKKHSFEWSLEADPHKFRTKEILHDHPEIRKLVGRNPYTFLVLIFCVGFQLFLTWLLRSQAWWVIVLSAYLVGAFVCHTLFVCIHECAHNLIFKSSKLNTLAAILANLPLVFPSAVTFQKCHLKHHAYQGVEELDADMPFRWEAALIHNSTFGKAVWLLFYPIFQALRTIRLHEVKLLDKWNLLNIVIQVSFMGGLYYLMGGKAIAFMTLSFFFSVGLHPLGARWIQEHFLTHGNQETKSYYGPLNHLNLNVGYHNEHHDFPSIPWNRLPQIKRSAPTFYNKLAFHTSYTGLLIKFLFDPNLSVYSRMARAKRSKSSKPGVLSNK